MPLSNARELCGDHSGVEMSKLVKDIVDFLVSATLLTGKFERNADIFAFFRQKEHNVAVARELGRIASSEAIPFVYCKNHRGIVLMEQ